MPNEYKLIVAGGRDFDDYKLLSKSIWSFANATDDEISIISGMAKGADSMAAYWARENNVMLYEYPANWNGLGKKAGFIRNTEMGKAADGALIFWDGKSRGTEHMIKFMEQLKKPVIIVNY